MTESYEVLKKEYEEFAYTVSHDLNAPLRHLKLFSEMLINELTDQVSQEEKQYLEYMQKSLMQLDSMQSALLTFSRINTRTRNHERIDCNKLVEQISKNITTSRADEKPEIQIEDLPIVFADKSLLELIFSNLIDNAVKFHETDGDNRIHISCDEDIKHHIFKISDNGIGIDAKFHEEVFRIFRRLHSEGIYPGTGAGLTFARKAVARLGGEIWIDSQPGNGTTVTFTIEKQS